MGGLQVISVGECGASWVEQDGSSVDGGTGCYVYRMRARGGINMDEGSSWTPGPSKLAAHCAVVRPARSQRPMGSALCVHFGRCVVVG